MAIPHMMACRMYDDVLKAPASVAIGLVAYGCVKQPARVVGGGIHGVFPFVESFPRWDESVLLFVGPWSMIVFSTPVSMATR